MPKASTKSPRANRHNPLYHDVTATGVLRTETRKKKQEEEDDEHYVEPKATRKILQIGQELAAEDQPEAKSIAFDFDYREPEEDEQDYGDEVWGEDEVEEVEEEADPADLDMFTKFVPEEKAGQSLADLILAKIAAHEEADFEPIRGPGMQEPIELPPKVVEVYTKIGLILSRYKSGKLPKPFKIIPSLPNWEEILDITRPDSWTPNACYEATKIFTSNLNPAKTRRFLESVILDRVREDIHETKKLNVHLYKSLKKSLYKPAAFFKGFLFPLVESGTCTLREAHIVSSVLARVSIPVLHSAAALLRLCEIAAEQSGPSLISEGTGAANIFIRTLIEKKYALPYKVIDALVFHLLRYRAAPEVEATSKLPVLWHQSFLAFAQRYRNDITEDQREALLDLLVVQPHPSISPEVRRELLEGRGRGVPLPLEAGADDGDDTMDVS